MKIKSNHPSSTLLQPPAASPSLKPHSMEEKDKNQKKNKKQKLHQHHPNYDQTSKTASDFSFKPCSEVKGLRFGGQFIVKSFTIRRAKPLELLRLLSLPPPNAHQNHHQQQQPDQKTTTTTAGATNNNNKVPFPSTTAFLPTNFTILAHHAWHTLTLGLGTKKSKPCLLCLIREVSIIIHPQLLLLPPPWFIKLGMFSFPLIFHLFFYFVFFLICSVCLIGGDFI
ncbi:hypothetical protein M9H77_11045 [Catharanthus roseus]|uniref:Uncharacterized protein n=1 Tax=Catharanthus roseus TaxID=4058 RepID=A0ACC0BDE7_CATRO|nr:hypothetical protein M9H77_11045 [Catharanthus roseus]